jgi:hypothetical protein
MRVARICATVALALLCASALAADAGKGKAKSKAESTSGTLAEAPAGGDAKVLGVLKAVDGDKTTNVIAGSDDIATQIKDLVKKGAMVNITGQFNTDRTSITVSAISEAGVPSDKKSKKKK